MTLILLNNGYPELVIKIFKKIQQFNAQIKFGTEKLLASTVHWPHFNEI